MNEYIVNYFVDSTGKIHESAEKSRFNQQCIVVTAASRDDAKEKARKMLNDDN